MKKSSADRTFFQVAFSQESPSFSFKRDIAFELQLVLGVVGRYAPMRIEDIRDFELRVGDKILPLVLEERSVYGFRVKADAVALRAGEQVSITPRTPREGKWYVAFFGVERVSQPAEVRP